MKLLLKNSVGPAVDIIKLTPQINWSGDYQQCSRTLTFNLLSSPVDANVPAIACDLGNAVTFVQDDRVLFEGFVFERQKSTVGSTISVICFDRGFYLKKNRSSYKFAQLTPEAIAARVCADFQIQAGEIVATGVKLSRNFLGNSLYDIIQTAYNLAANETKKRYYITFRGAKLCVLEKKVTDETLIIEGGANLMDASVTESVQNMVNQVVIYDKNDKLIRTLKNDNLISLYGLMQEYIKQAENTDVAPKAQRILDDGGEQQKITINNLGNVANVAGGSVVVREPYTGLYGLFYIDSDTHTWKKGLYLNKLVLNFKNLMDEKEAGSLPNKTGDKTATSGTWSYVNTPGGSE